MTITRSVLLLLCALGLFVLGALVFFGAIDWTLADGLGIDSVGLACLAGSAVP
jgi:hypothetical protein